MINIDIEL